MKKNTTDRHHHSTSQATVELLRDTLYPLTGKTNDLDPLIKFIGDASFVLLGEASHGTHEFYKTRAELTKRLITEKNFTVIAIEGDWPDTHRVNRYIRSQEVTEQNSIRALADFQRFPAWMWRNQEIVEFISWLREYNSTQTSITSLVGFYGLDLYSLHRSMESVIHTLEKIDPQSAQRARERYACFDTFGLDPQSYGYFASLYPSHSCRSDVLAQLCELRKQELSFFKPIKTGNTPLSALEERLYIEQNALVVKNAEHYYRSLFEGSPAQSWNIRDSHMMETLESLVMFTRSYTKQPKVIIWAHNSHLGDARATQMSSYGEHNLGQLVREKYGNQAVLVGFTTYTGTVSAASSWSGPVQRKHVRPALEASYEALFHETGIPNFLLIPNQNPQLRELLNKERLERAIGVIYAPHTERASHYFYARLPDQFDAIIHFDRTHAVSPLDKTAEWEQGELPETYPFGT